ncbi:hypothetical protein DFS34DRAFT_408319 [Phlyctochytrium arcticum]|nr:hypothetical protein DFS34DRAFT_408319 [Phlyctochytrium arcticum]
MNVVRCAVAGLLCRVFRPSHVTDSRVAKLRAAYAESNTPQISLCRLLQLYTSGKTSKSSENTKVCEKSRPIKSRKLTAKTSTVDDTELLGFFSKDFQEDPEDILVIIDHLQHALNQKYLRKLQAQLLRLLLSSSESRWSANLRAKPRVEDLGFACHATNGLVPGLEEELRLFARLYDGSTNTQEAFSIFALLLSEGNHESIRGTIQKLLRTYIFAAPDSKAGFVRMLTELIVRVAEKPPGPGEADGRQQIIQHIVKSMEGFLLVSLMNASLRFYESVSTIFLNSAAPQVPLPCTALLNRLFFGSSGMSLSRITSVVADYKELYETFGNIGTINGLEADAHLRDLDQLNSYIMDICDFVWRNKAFINNHPLSKSFGMSRLASEALVKDAANNHVEICRLYNLAFAPSLLSFAAEYAKLGLAIDHAPVTAKVISSLPDPTMHYQDWRVYLLEFLKERGFTGFYYFMFSSLRSLVEFRDNRVSSTGTSPGNSLG